MNLKPHQFTAQPALIALFARFYRPSRMIQIRPPPRVHMNHQVQHAVALQHALARLHGYIVARFDGQGGIDFDMRVGHDQIAHLARAHVVNVAHAGSFQQGLADGGDFFIICRAVH